MARRLPWMANKEELRSARTLNTIKVVGTDCFKVHVTSDDVLSLYKLSEKFLDLVRQCQTESFAKELGRLKKTPSTSSLLVLAPVLGDDGLGHQSGCPRLPFDQLHPPF